MRYCDFDTFTSQTIIRGNLRLQSGLNIGGADLSDIVDNPVARIKIGGEEIPYLPGSSVKGVLRSEVERVFRSIGERVCEIPNVCDPKQDTDEDYCMVCGIFGGMNLAGHVRLRDCLTVNDTVHVGIKPGVAINRTLGTAQSGALYNLEVIHPSQKFGFTMVVDNINLISPDGTQSSEDTRSKALWYILNRLMSGSISLGRKSTSGLGDVILEDLRMEVLLPSKDSFVKKQQYAVKAEGNDLKIEEV